MALPFFTGGEETTDERGGPRTGLDAATRVGPRETPRLLLASSCVCLQLQLQGRWRWGGSGRGRREGERCQGGWRGAAGRAVSLNGKDRLSLQLSLITFCQPFCSLSCHQAQSSGRSLAVYRAPALLSSVQSDRASGVLCCAALPMWASSVLPLLPARLLASSSGRDSRTGQWRLFACACETRQ